MRSGPVRPPGPSYESEPRGVGWSPDGTRIAYVSLENRKPVVYIQSLATGQRQVLANFKGSNSAEGSTNATSAR